MATARALRRRQWEKEREERDRDPSEWIDRMKRGEVEASEVVRHLMNRPEVSPAVRMELERRVAAMKRYEASLPGAKTPLEKLQATRENPHLAIHYARTMRKIPSSPQ